VAAGPAVLGDVLRTAIADGKTDLAAVAATALGRVTDANALAADGTVNPLVETLSAPGRRARFAAARALVALDPRRPFAGSSRVVPVLAQFLAGGPVPRAVVIDGNLARGNMLAAQLRALGFDPVVAQTGAEGFRAASESADVELVLIDIHLTQGNWRLHDTLANLRADARTAGLPVYVVGPLARQADLASLEERFPGVRFLVTSTDPKTLDQQLGVAGRPQPLSSEERAGYAREAAALLAEIAARPNSPFEPDLARVEPALAAALNAPETGVSASAALGDVPVPDAQRGLADVLTDPSKPAPLRLSAAAQLARSIQRFGPLVAADQEVKLQEAFDRADDPALRTALGSVVGALRPKAGPTGVRLRQIAPAPDPAGTPNPNPTGPAASPAAPGTEAQP
jgi:CheY-like chemotaxis protein